VVRAATIHLIGQQCKKNWPTVQHLKLKPSTSFSSAMDGEDSTGWKCTPLTSKVPGLDKPPSFSSLPYKSLISGKLDMAREICYKTVYLISKIDGRNEKKLLKRKWSKI
jgi:hypothetical protein